MSRKELENIIAAQAWSCNKCRPRPRAQNATADVVANSISEKKSEFQKRGTLKIMQWNADDIRTKIAELEAAIKDHRVDICVIQESKLQCNHRDPHVEGYSTIRKDRPPKEDGSTRKGGGLILFVKEDIPFTVMTMKNTQVDSALEIMGIRIRDSEGANIQIVNGYCPPVCNTQDEDRVPGFNPDDLAPSRKTIIIEVSMPTLLCGTQSSLAT